MSFDVVMDTPANIRIDLLLHQGKFIFNDE